MTALIVAQPTPLACNAGQTWAIRWFRCKACRRTFNERTGTLFNFIEVPTDIVF